MFVTQEIDQLILDNLQNPMNRKSGLFCVPIKFVAPPNNSLGSESLRSESYTTIFILTIETLMGESFQ